jgi:hypothetical protein
LPSAGEIVLFDRSWYNRAGVERVMGYANEDQVRGFLAQVPVFEKLLVDDGILLFKYWLCCDQAEQEHRFAEATTRSSGGSFRPSILPRASTARTIPGPAKPCWRPLTRPRRPGRSSISTTSVAVA